MSSWEMDVEEMFSDNKPVDCKKKITVVLSNYLLCSLKVEKENNSSTFFNKWLE